MALSVNGGGGFGSRRRGSSGTLSEINVTPFVDVVLVLLIIFMLTAHVMEFGIDVDVPKTRMVKDTAKEMPVVSITKDGTTWLNDKPVNINDLPAAIRQRYGGTKGVYIRADKQTIWEMVAQVTAEMGDAGFTVNMVTQPEDSSAKGRKR
jgi:biopolymer transport protein ExbD/biopolymer transport protein TolR